MNWLNEYVALSLRTPPHAAARLAVRIQQSLGSLSALFIPNVLGYNKFREQLANLIGINKPLLFMHACIPRVRV